MHEAMGPQHLINRAWWSMPVIPVLCVRWEVDTGKWLRSSQTSTAETRERPCLNMEEGKTN